MQHQPVVAGTIVGCEHIDVRHDIPLIGDIRRGDERGEQVGAAAVGEGAVAVIALLVYVICTGQPMFVESVLNAAGGMNGVGRFVRRADETTGDRVSGSWNWC